MQEVTLGKRIIKARRTACHSSFQLKKFIEEKQSICIRKFMPDVKHSYRIYHYPPMSPQTCNYENVLARKAIDT